MPLNKSVAVVNDEIITLLNASLFHQLSAVLAKIKENKKLTPSDFPFEMTQDQLKITIEKLIVIELLFQELRKFKIDPITPDEALNRIKPFFIAQNSFETILSKLNTTEKIFLGLLAKKYSTDFFIETKFNDKTLFVTDNEINEYIEKHKISKTQSDRQKIIDAIKVSKNQSRISFFITNLFERSNVKYIHINF